MKRYRKKPLVIEAVQLGGGVDSNGFDVAKWCGGDLHPNGAITIPTLEGEHRASVGDYVIRGVAGEFYPCKPDIFAATYEPVTEGR